jgi:anti-sigma factor RsiW
MNTMFGQHCTEASLELYALGQLDEATTETIEEHLLVCDACRERLDAEDRYVHAMSAAASRLRLEPAPGSSRILDKAKEWFRMPVPIWGAAALAACLMVVVSTIPMRHGIPASGTPVAVALLAERGGSAQAPAQRLLDLKLDARGLSLGQKVRVALVDARGVELEEAVVPQTGESINLKTHAVLQPGQYYVRAYAAGAVDPAREFAMEVK